MPKHPDKPKKTTKKIMSQSERQIQALMEKHPGMFTAIKIKK